MARRNEEYARLNPGGGYTQALAVGKGFSGAERRAAKQGDSSGSTAGGTMNAYARHQELIRNYHRYHACVSERAHEVTGMLLADLRTVVQRVHNL